MMNKLWKLKAPGNDNDISEISRLLNVENIIANLLVQRGIKTFNDAKKFFRPDLNDLHDPFLMKDMNRAVDRINRAIKNNERILVYGDYDVDGTTAVALLYSFFRDRYTNIDFYIPDRYTEGYGISFQGIDYAHQNGCTLVIALDCGIKALDKIKYATHHRIDFIVCDHHTPGDEIPRAVAILDPKRHDCDYPYKHLSGCGVGYKLLQAYSQKNNIPKHEIDIYLDLICVSIASDIVPMTGENRILMYHGLLLLNKNPGPGLLSIIRTSGLEGKEITVNDIVFKIAPIINAAGRIESGKKAVELLISATDDFAGKAVGEMNSFNMTRKDFDRTITEEARKIIDENEELQKRKSTVLFKSDWHKGIIGIVASRLTEFYYRPTVIMTESNGYATGSARSVEGYDLYKAVDSCSDLLENYGGHMYAAGLTMKLENIEKFSERFEDYVSRSILEEQLTPFIEIDNEISFDDITPKFYRVLKQFAPFGPSNMSPLFITRNVTDYGKGKLVGKTSDHLKMDLMQNDDKNKVIPAIAFNLGENFKFVEKRIPFDICYHLVENEFLGKTNLQLYIKDIKLSQCGEAGD